MQAILFDTLKTRTPEYLCEKLMWLSSVNLRYKERSLMYHNTEQELSGLVSNTRVKVLE